MYIELPAWLIKELEATYPEKSPQARIKQALKDFVDSNNNNDSQQ